MSWRPARLNVVILAAVLLAVTAPLSPARAQDYTFLDYTGYLLGVDGMRVYFDASVDVAFGGTLQSPMYNAASTTATPSAWLVLVNPGAPAMSGWEARFDAVGQGSVSAVTLLGDGAANAGSGDDYLVTYASPRPTTDVHIPLLRLDLLLQVGGIGWYTFGEMFFHTAPAAGGHAMPGWTTSTGAFRPSHSLTSAYHGWEYPCLTLNSNFGVTETDHYTWGAVKALFRSR